MPLFPYTFDLSSMLAKVVAATCCLLQKVKGKKKPFPADQSNKEVLLGNDVQRKIL